MSGTKAGGKKTAETNKRLHGSDFYAKIGAKGGRNGHTGGFAADHERARIAGAKGGKKSRRTGIKNGEGKYKRPKKTTQTNKKNTNARLEPEERVFREYAVIEQPKKKGLFSKIFGRGNG